MVCNHQTNHRLSFINLGSNRDSVCLKVIDVYSIMSPFSFSDVADFLILYLSLTYIPYLLAIRFILCKQT